MNLVDEVIAQSAQLSPAPELIPDPIKRLQAQSNFVLRLLADLDPATAIRLQGYAIAFSIYRRDEFEKLKRLSKRDATVQDIVKLWTEAAEDFVALTNLHDKICAAAPRSRLADEAKRLAAYARGMITLQANGLREYNERC